MANKSHSSRLCLIHLELDRYLTVHGTVRNASKAVLIGGISYKGNRTGVCKRHFSNDHEAERRTTVTGCIGTSICSVVTLQPCFSVFLCYTFVSNLVVLK